MRSPGFSLSSIFHVSCGLETTASHLCASVSLSEVKRPDSALLRAPPALISQESSEGSANEGTQLQEGDAPSGARAWQATGAEAAGGRLPPGRALLGEQIGVGGGKMAAAWGGACAITSSTIPTHTLAFGQSRGLKIATTSSSAISRASYPREPTVPGPDPKGPGMLRLSWDAERRGATGPHSKVGRTRSGHCWSRVHSLLPDKRAWPLPAALAETHRWLEAWVS